MDQHDLYALPLEEFTAARNALAKELARSGDPAASADVKRLAKPTKTAWALNQAARRAPEDVARLLEAGARVREAQERALAGDASQLRAASRAEQELVDPLVAAALSVMGRDTSAAGEGGHRGGGHGSATDRLRGTLRAAATDPEVGTLLREGRLVADLEPSGFGLEGLSGPAGDGPLAPAAPPGAGAGTGRATREERSASKARAARREVEELRLRADTARTRAERLADQATRAERRAEEARRDAADAADAASGAERAVEEAKARADALER